MKTRTRIDSRIAAATTDVARRSLAMHGQDTPPSRIQSIVGEWHMIRALIAQSQKTQKRELEVARYRLAEKRAAEFVRDAMLTWDADALIALGREMKRATATSGQGLDLDARRRSLLACGISSGKAAKAIVGTVLRKPGTTKQIENEKRTLQRIKASWHKG